jgi:branched-chain amino acid transport system permease protein
MYKLLTHIAVRMKWIIVALLIVMIVLPFFVSSPYILRILTVALMYIMIATSLNFLTGFLGMMTLGHAAFWGIGSYTAAIITTRLPIGMGVGMICAALVCGIVSFLLGLAVLKLKSYYLTVTTLGFCEIVRLIEMNWMPVTRGPLGIPGIPYPNIFGIDLSSHKATYYVILVLAVLSIFIVYSLIHSRIGIGIIACREDDLAASAMGINVFKYRVMVFVISAMMVGVAGAFYAHYITFIDPSSFTTAASIDMLVMTIFGGLGSIPGTILGATILTVLPETMRILAEYRTLIYGILIVVLMLVKPSGLLGNINFKYLKQRYEQSKNIDKNDQLIALKSDQGEIE